MRRCPPAAETSFDGGLQPADLKTGEPSPKAEACASCRGDAWLVPVLVIGVWLPAMMAAAPVWRHGLYYDYGWFVPLAATGLTLLRWFQSPPGRPLSRRWIAAWCGLLPWFLLLRVLGHVDPSWRMPIWLLGITAAVFSHCLLAAACGWRRSASYLCISLLWLSALPWPSVMESGIIQWLTDRVVMVTAEWFQWLGRPVMVIGDRLQLHEISVEVTDGCSGIRSFQSFLMASWFFAEWQRLRPDRIAILLGCACLTAFAVNLGRTFALAQIRFDHGESAFQRAHDPLGLAAFAASAVIFYYLSGMLNSRRRQLVRHPGTRGDAAAPPQKQRSNPLISRDLP